MNRNILRIARGIVAIFPPLVPIVHTQASPATGAPPLQLAATDSSMANVSDHSQRLSGRLFFSREQRERIDRARARGELSQGGEDIEELPPSTLNGFVKRSDGQTMIWVDGQARYNVQADGVRRLQPQDVGNSGDSMRVLAVQSESARQSPVSVRTSHSSKSATSKPPAKKKPRGPTPATR